jgi:hypothetical protein
VASSIIEDLVGAARVIAGAEVLGDGGRHSAAMIVGNTEAMNSAVASADQIDEDATQRCMQR